MSIISYCDKDKIMSEVRDLYDEYRSEHQSPRTNYEKNAMIEFILSPLLDRLSDFNSAENAAQTKIDRIQEILS
jgi:hypothetical protein